MALAIRHTVCGKHAAGRRRAGASWGMPLTKTRSATRLGPRRRPVALAAITKCRYCLFYHTELAKLNGATAAEIEDAVHFAKSSAGWSTYITGMGTDYEQFKQQVLAACEHARQHAARSAPPRLRDPEAAPWPKRDPLRPRGGLAHCGPTVDRCPKG